jgi:V8-like Glu-specific endopeptidase
MGRQSYAGGLRRYRLAALIAAPLAWPLAATAQQPADDVTASPEPAAEARDSGDYWTSERLRGAQPKELPAPAITGPEGLPEGAQVEGPELTRTPREGEGGSGAPPTIDPGDSLGRQLPFEPAEMSPGAPTPRATSSFGAFFTTTRVFPDAATTTYPYRTVGKLFFRDPRRNTNNVCSGAVLRPRLVATAGHCVTSPSTDPAQRYFFTNFLFVPSFNNGAAPFGSWSSSRQWVLTAWHNSNGAVPNPGDVAILMMNDQQVNAQTRTIGSITGWLGWQINALSRNHLTLLGYPCNLDACARMQMTNAGSFASGGQNTFVYGSASRGGHSGGPWIQDFGVAAAGSPPNTLGLNLLVGITSYGPTATEPKYLGASIFDNSFVNLLNTACNASAGNC